MPSRRPSARAPRRRDGHRDRRRRRVRVPHGATSRLPRPRPGGGGHAGHAGSRSSGRPSTTSSSTSPAAACARAENTTARPPPTHRRRSSMTHHHHQATARPSAATERHGSARARPVRRRHLERHDPRAASRCSVSPCRCCSRWCSPWCSSALFAPLLPDVEAGSALQWFVPGIIVMTALMGASMTGSNLSLEMNTGSHERLLVSPLRRSSLLVGRALKEVVPVLAAGPAHRRRRDAVLLRPVRRRGGRRARPRGAVHRRHRRSVVRAGARVQGPGLAVLDRPADADLPSPPARRGAAPARRGAPAWLQLPRRPQPADLRRRGRAGAVRRALPADTITAGVAAAAGVAVVGLLVGLVTMRRAD